MSYEYINYEVKNSAGRITFNRPDVLNSFNMSMALEVQEALKECRDNSEIRAILITGEGRAFCAGQDLAEAVPPDGSPGPEIEDIVKTSYNPVIRLIRGIEKPVICAVNGVAAGAGANIALACDFVFASDAASFIQAFVKIGLIPDSGGTWTLPRLVGLQRATALTMLGEKLSASDAHSIGLIYKVVEAEKLLPEASGLAEYLATQPTYGIGLTKRALNKSFENSLEEQLDLEMDLQGQAGKSHDYLEGVKAFQEKRAPEFKGN
ncbi:MAG TPA: enoyl-CoA hydratase [bacterium]